ncbi:MAG: hypothetical protein K5859_01775 [Atopobiaceae bacterium]|nr:hypothetical protein [Atopobiaceae bacterium]
MRGTLSKYCLRRHVTGRMCNTPDHALVVAELQGERDAVEKVLDSVKACYSDPSHSRGMTIEVTGELPLVEGEQGMSEVSWEDMAPAKEQS